MSAPKHTPKSFNVVRTMIDMNAPVFKNIHSISSTDDTNDIYAELKCNLIDLDHISKCVNMHDELVEELNRLAGYANISGIDIKKANELIERAKGEA